MRSILLWLSKSEKIPAFTKRHKFFWRIASRFVAGEIIQEAIVAVRKVNNAGMRASIDHLGESISNAQEAKDAAIEYINLIEKMEKSNIQCNVSLKLTQMGIDIDPELCKKNLISILECAKKHKRFVRIDMEDSPYTDITLEIFEELYPKYKELGVVIQSYMFRSKKDVERLVDMGANVRMVKGAYKEPPEIAYPKKSDVDNNFIRLSKILLSKKAMVNGCKCDMATHDEKIIEKMISFIKKNKIPTDFYEFQMLYGIRRDLQRSLTEDGHTVRVYVPYGKDWYPYFMRRLAERPANVIFLLKNIVKS